MNENKLTTINLSLKQKEKDEIVKKAIDEGYATTSAFLIDRAQQRIKVEAVYNGFRELTIEVNRIGTNINQIIRDIHTNNYFTDQQVEDLENELKKLNQFLRNERNKIKEDERYFIKFPIDDLNERLKKQLNYHEELTKIDNIIDGTIDLLIDFVEQLEQYNLDNMFSDYIYQFIKKLDHNKYDHLEAMEMFRDVNNKTREINQRLTNPKNKMTKHDFKEIRKVIQEHRK